MQNLELMPDPHAESGSQDAFVIDAADSLVPLQDITAMRCESSFFNLTIESFVNLCTFSQIPPSAAESELEDV